MHVSVWVAISLCCGGVCGVYGWLYLCVVVVCVGVCGWLYLCVVVVSVVFVGGYISVLWWCDCPAVSGPGLVSAPCSRYYN